MFEDKDRKLCIICSKGIAGYGLSGPGSGQCRPDGRH